MTGMRIFFILVLTIFTVSPAFTERERAQGGDQFLDGIGETALMARYAFNGNAEDGSRNNFRATLRGTGAAFVRDSRFGNVLNLPGNGSHVQLPGNALTGEETISVTGWLFLNSDTPVQLFFAFGQNAAQSFSATVTEAGSDGASALSSPPALRRAADPPTPRFQRISGSTSPWCWIRPIAP